MIPAASGEQSDEVWLVVKRYINGQTVRYIEILEDGSTGTSAQNDCFYVDSGLTYSGSPTTTISGLLHLEGATISVLADGGAALDVVVTNGKVTLSQSASVVQLGLSYRSKVLTMPLEISGATGTSQGKLRRISEVTIRVLRSLGAKIGPDVNNLERSEEHTSELQSR